MNVFYFNARFVFEDQPYEERNQYGFLAAEDFIHAMKQINEVSVKVVIHFKGVYLRFAEQHATRTTEYIDKPVEFNGKTSIQNVQYGCLVSNS